MHIASLNSVPVIKPKKAPNPDLQAYTVLFPPIISPKNAPKNGPIIIPQGGKRNIPTRVPATQPRVPHLLPPQKRVVHIGIR